MRRLAPFAAAACAAALVPSAAGTARVPPQGARVTGTPVFTVSGRGWGHGVGMSQWGAYGFARRGTSYTAILGHYYRGTSLARSPVTRVRVLLASGQQTLTVGSAAPFRVRDGFGETHDVETRSVAFGPGLRLRVAAADGLTQLVGPLTFLPGPAPLELRGKRYRGTFEVDVERGRLRAINAVGLEAYLWGVVPDEMPHTWPAEALKAQAVVARSYALAVRRTSGPFDLYPDVRSQVYGGVDAEEPPATAAVNATAGQVLVHQGAVARTYFFSTSGGRTANVEDVWPGQSVPYLVSVPDPYDGASPHHRWGPLPYTAARLGKLLGARGPVVDVRTVTNRSGRVAQVVATGRTGETVVTGADARSRLGLRSTWFAFGVLRLDRPRASVRWGTSVRLSGIARGVPQVALEQRVPGGIWERALPVAAGRAGAFTVAVRVAGPVEYRLASGRATTASVRVPVAPVVRIAPGAPGTVEGTVQPALPGAAVAVQQQHGARWATVARARVDAAGAFTASLVLAPGTYRAVVGATRGFAAGTSQLLVVEAP